MRSNSPLPLKSRPNKQHVCPFPIYLQSPTMGTACSESSTQLPQCLGSLTHRRRPGWPRSQLWEQAESCNPVLKSYPLFSQELPSKPALQCQLQHHKVQSSPPAPPRPRPWVPLLCMKPSQSLFQQNISLPVRTYIYPSSKRHGN